MWTFTHGPLLLGAITLPPIAGTLAVTEDDDTLVSTGTLPIAGTLAANEDSDTLVATGTLPSASGSLAATEDDDTLVATGSLPITGTLAVTEDDDTLLDESAPPELPPMPSDGYRYGKGKGRKPRIKDVDPFVTVVVDPDDGATEVVEVPRGELKAALPDINKILDEVDRVRMARDAQVVTINPDDEEDMLQIMRLLAEMED